MKNIQKGFVVPLIIAIIAILAVGGGAYVYTKNNTRQKVLSDSKTYNSPIGFSISYPSNWIVTEEKSVDTTLGTVRISSPGTNTGSPFKLEQLFNIHVGVALESITLEQLKNKSRKIFDVQDSILSRKIIDEKNIKINGNDAYEIIYTEKNNNDNTLFKSIRVYMLANPSGLKYPKLAEIGMMISMGYTARPDVFDQVLAEEIIGSFKENILPVYEKKMEEEVGPQRQPETIKIPTIPDGKTENKTIFLEQ